MYTCGGHPACVRDYIEINPNLYGFFGLDVCFSQSPEHFWIRQELKKSLSPIVHSFGLSLSRAHNLHLYV